MNTSSNFTNRAVYSVLAVFAFLVLASCGSDSNKSAPVGGGSLAIGTFNKSVVYTTTFWSAQFSGTIPMVRYMHLYRASDIQGSGNIATLRMRYDSDLVSEVSCTNTSIKLGHTNVTNLTTTFADAIETGEGSFETVVNDAQITIPAGSMNTFFGIPLSTPFYYNGADNLVVEISRTTVCTGTVSLDAGNAVGYTASTFTTLSNTNTTGSISTSNLSMGFDFAGGDSALVFGGTNGNTWPFDTVLPRTQSLYLGSEIDGSGPITGLGFQLNATSNVATYTYTVKLGHTTLSALGTIYADNYDAGSPVTVANGAVFTIPAGIPAGEWFWLPLPDNTFTYNGTDNLIVDVQVTTATDDNTLRQTFTSAGRRAWGNTLPDVADGVDTVTCHIKLRFNGGTMDAGLGAPSISSQVFDGTSDGAEIQSLYTASELGASGSITYVSLRLDGASNAATHSDYTLRMGHTTKSILITADTYAGNMDENATVFSGSFDIPAGLLAGDWVTIPLSTPFSYDSTKNLAVLFSTSGGAGIGNNVKWKSSAAQYPGRVVGSATGGLTNPTWQDDGIVTIKFGLSK